MVVQIDLGDGDEAMIRLSSEELAVMAAGALEHFDDIGAHHPEVPDMPQERWQTLTHFFHDLGQRAHAKRTP